MHVSLSSTAVLGYEERWCKHRIGFKQPTMVISSYKFRQNCQKVKWANGVKEKR